MDGFFLFKFWPKWHCTKKERGGVEKYPGNPLSDMQGRGKRKVSNPTHNGSTIVLGTSG